MSRQDIKTKMQAVSFSQVTVEDSFWKPRMTVNRERTIPHQYQECKQTGRIDAFDLNWQPGMEPMPHYFWDSDVAKWIEAASYSLVTHPDPKLEALLDEVIAKIVSAQQPDGYLNVYFTVVEPEKRWKNLGMWHELYCAGHLIEAAVAHYEATGKRTLLDAMCRYADYIDSVFGPGKRDGAPGHQEIELALVKLYRVTGNERYLALSMFFLDQRGQKPSVFERELAHLSEEDARLNRHFFCQGDTFDSRYCQDHLPVREQREVTGHAVRAMYMYCAMVDVGIETGDEALIEASRRLWENVCRRRMYITGGIGPSRDNEGFTVDYDLPNETAYAETCAAVGLIFWNHRLLHIDGDGRYADEMERALYNGSISGISLDGEKFFYVNPLASKGNHHRQSWFGCACCPPNISRLIASIGGYIYSESADTAYVNLYVAGEGNVRVGDLNVKLSQRSNYPWDGDIKLVVAPERAAEFTLALRIPSWARSAQVRVRGRIWDHHKTLESGYVKIHRLWWPGDVVELYLPMPVELVESHPAVAANAGVVAIQRGPVVYCLEAVDNPVPLHRIVVPTDTEFAVKFEPDLLGGVVTVSAEAFAVDDGDWEGTLYRAKSDTAEKRVPVTIKAIPYYAWDHREPGEMRVWLRSC